MKSRVIQNLTQPVHPIASRSRSAERTDPDPSGGRRRVIWRRVLGGAAIAVPLAMALRLIPPLFALPATGVLLVGVAPSSSGPAARPLARTRRTFVVSAAMVALMVLELVTMSGPGQVFVTRHLSRPVADAVLLVLLLMMIAVMALPLALPESTQLVDALPAGRPAITRRDAVLAATGLVTVILAHVYATSFLLVAACAVLLPPLTAVLRVRDSARHRMVTVFRRPLGAGRRVHLLQFANIAVFWSLLAATVMTGAVDLVAYLVGSTATTISVVVVAGCAAGVLLALLSGPRVLLGINVLAAAGSLFIAGQLAGIYHPATDPVTLPSPVTGQWYVVQGGRAELVNHHRAALAQDDALDLVQLVGGASHRGDPQDLRSYYCYGQALLAPAPGRVVTVQAGFPDQAIGSADRDNPPGNHVVIDIGGGRYVAFGHLRPGSIAVSVGDQVSVGQQIAEVGNSGNTSEPHLHLQVQNTAEFDVDTPAVGTRTYPWLFRDVTLTRRGDTSHPTTTDLRRGDSFASTAS